ncbi:hypothetical protein AOLI_G00142490 [Acnodon oligacanthus]
MTVVELLSGFQNPFELNELSSTWTWSFVFSTVNVLINWLNDGGAVGLCVLGLAVPAAADGSGPGLLGAGAQVEPLEPCCSSHSRNPPVGSEASSGR